MKATVTLDLNQIAKILLNANRDGDTDEFFTTEYAIRQTLGRETFQKVNNIFKRMKQNNSIHENI